MKDNREKVRAVLKKALLFLTNPRLLFCWIIAWFITNGWSYALLVAGTHLDISWMVNLASAYIAFLWLPFTPEKFVTIAIAIALLRWLFPNDQKTLGLLKSMHQKLKGKRQDKKGTTGSAVEGAENDRDAVH